MPQHEEFKVSRTVLIDLVTYVNDNFMDTGEGDWSDCTEQIVPDFGIVTTEQVVDKFMEKNGYTK